MRQVADRATQIIVDPGGDEAVERGARGVGHAKRCVARTGQLRRKLDEPLKHGVERELGGERHARLDKRPHPLRRVLDPTDLNCLPPGY